MKGRKSGFGAEGRNTHFNQNRIKKQFKKVRRGLGNSGTTISVPTSEIYGCQKEKRRSKTLKTYLNR